jgi:hypothetical protein
MSGLRRLVTLVDVRDAANKDRFSVSARHELELADGTRVLLDNRGWSGSGGWASESIEQVQRTAHFVVGPDEPVGDRSPEEMADLYWAQLQQTAQRQGVVTDAAELRELPHDVILTPRLQARIEAARR